MTSTPGVLIRAKVSFNRTSKMELRLISKAHLICWNLSSHNCHFQSYMVALLLCAMSTLMFEITTPKVTQPEFQLFYFFTCLNSRHLVIRKEDITFLGNKWLSTGCCLAPGCPRSQAAQRHNHDEIRNDSPTNYLHLKSCKDGEGMICLTFRNFWVGCKYFERDWCGAYLVQKAIRSFSTTMANWPYSQKSSSFKNQK